MYTAWSAAVLATLLGLVGVSTYQVAAAQPQTERCTVSALSPIYSTVTGTHYRVIETSCGKYEIDPGNSATSVLEPVAADSIALTGSPDSGRSYLLTFHGWGSERTLVSARSR